MSKQPHRTEEDIKELRVFPHIAGAADAWVVEIGYTDGYACTYKVERSPNITDMLQEVMQTVKIQLRDGEKADA